MPVITVEVAEMNKEQKAVLVKEFTAILSRESGLPPEAIFVFIKENQLDNIGVGGKLLSDSD